MKGIVWNDESLGAKFDDVDIPEDMVEQAKEYREKMVEAAVELDDDALAAFLDGNEPDEATLKRLIRKAVLTGAFYPGAVRLGLQEQGRAAAARRRRRLSAVADRRARDQGHRRPTATKSCARLDDKEPLALLAFKIMDDPFVGTITFCRIYSGMLQSGTGVVNSTREKKERIGRMLLDACEQSRRHQGSLCRRHRRAGRPEGSAHW